MIQGAVFFYQTTAESTAFSTSYQPTLLSLSSPVEAPVLLRNASIRSHTLMSASLWQGRVENKETVGRISHFKVFAVVGTGVGRWITERQQQDPLACHRRPCLGTRRGALPL